MSKGNYIDNKKTGIWEHYHSNGSLMSKGNYTDNKKTGIWECYGRDGNITPTSLDEIKRWETNPTSEKLWSVPHIKYMRFLHPILRPIIIENWELIKTMKIN